MIKYFRHVNSRRFLTKPDPDSSGAEYQWGVNTGLQHTWGWIRSVEEESCPHSVNNWRVWDDKQEMWTHDDSLTVLCLPDL